jgi:hypothetical protein
MPSFHEEAGSVPQEDKNKWKLLGQPAREKHMVQGGRSVSGCSSGLHSPGCCRNSVGLSPNEGAIHLYSPIYEPRLLGEPRHAGGLH